MRWYLLHSKPRQEKTALENLERQGYECYLPMIRSEKLRRRKLVVVEEPLFSRYLFVRLGQDDKDKSWGPIRSTVGVSSLVRFGDSPAQADDNFVETIKRHEESFLSTPEPMFNSGDIVRITEGSFSGIDAVYQMPDGRQRALVLIEFLSKPVFLRVDPGSLSKIG